MSNIVPFYLFKKIVQKKDGIVFIYNSSHIKENIEQGINREQTGENKEKQINLEKLLKIYGNRIRFSPGAQNYITLKLKEGEQTEQQILKEIEQYLQN